MRLSVLPAHARSSSYAVAKTYRGNSDFCRRKSLTRRKKTVSNTFTKCGFMGFLIAVPATGTACLESLGWTSMDHIEVDAKVWPGIVAMEVGMAGDIIWGQTNERGGADTEKEVLLWRLEWPAIFLDLLLALRQVYPFFSVWSTWCQQRDAAEVVDPNNRRLTRETWWSRVLHFRSITRRLSNSIQDLQEF